nr:hypothetical protein [Tanacetum cinerariifolium]
MVLVVLARVVGLAGGFGCGVKCLRSNQNSLLVYLMMVSFLVLVSKIPSDKKRCRRSGGCGCSKVTSGLSSLRLAEGSCDGGEWEVEAASSLS